MSRLRQILAAFIRVVLMASFTSAATLIVLPGVESDSHATLLLATPQESANSLAAGRHHNCVVKGAGDLMCWGMNETAQLGDGTITDRSAPIDAIVLASAAAASAPGLAHTCVLTSQGGVQCWGSGPYGQLGNGTFTYRSTTPVDVVGLGSGVQDLVSAYAFSCAITTGGGAKCWGDNREGQLGNGTTDDSAVPVDVTGLGSGVRSIAGGIYHACAVTAGGGVKCWGKNTSGRLGDGTTTSSTTPVDVVGLDSGVSQVALGAGYSCALTDAGGVKCWGSNGAGCLGDGTTLSSSTPVDVVGLSSGVVAIAAGEHYTCALTGGGAVKCWGNVFPGLQTNATSTSLVPVGVVGLDSGVEDIQVGAYHACALLNDGRVKCWGRNVDGQLGNGTTTDSADPVDVLGFGGRTYSVSGRIVDEALNPLPGVIISDGAGHTTSTDGNGDYTVSGLGPATHTLTPLKDGFTFAPPSRTVAVPPDASGIGFTGSSAGGPSVDIVHLEVTQAIQFSDNSMPLIAGKRTAVRVYVDCGEGCTTLAGVTGSLQVSGAGGSTTIGPSNGPIVAEHPAGGWFSQRSNTRKSLNFSVEPAYIDGTVTFTAQVGGSSTSVTLPTQPGTKLRLAYVLMSYEADGTTRQANRDRAERGSAFLHEIFPLGSHDLEYFYQPGAVQVLKDTFDCAWWSCPADKYLKALETFWERTERQGGWQDGLAPDRLYGWVPTAARSGSLIGRADAQFSGGQGRVAAGIDTRLPQATLAHEIGHLFDDTGLRHAPNAPEDNDCSGEAQGADDNYPFYPGVPRGSIGTFGFSPAKQELYDPAFHYDFMSYCTLPWVSPYHYDKLLGGFASSQPDASILQAPAAAFRQLLVSGTVHTPTLAANFDPFYALTSTVPIDASSGADFCLETRDAGGGPLDSRCFDLSFRSEYDGPMDEDSFVWAIPYPPEVHQVVLTHLGTEIESATVTAHAPTVTLLYPNGGENLTEGQVVVSWTAGDLDGDALYYALDYSRDAGMTWIAAGINITTTQHILDLSDLPGGVSALLRVSATDGINTATDLADATFAVSSKAPWPVVLWPQPDDVFTPGTLLLLEGSAYDLEDGALDGSALEWSSSLDGYLGSGQDLFANLSPGQHVISLTVIDSDGHSATASINLLVGYRTQLPILLRSVTAGCCD
jgi:alpha-tubulin suppressor-like RCC1 family protein